MIKLSDIKISIKLAVISGLGILLVAGILGNQMRADSSISTAVHAANDRLLMARDLQSILAAERGMQFAVNESLVSSSKDDLAKTLAQIANYHKSAGAQIDAMIPAFDQPERRAQAEKIKALVDRYAADAGKIGATKGEILTLRGNGLPDEVDKADRLTADIQRFAREGLRPIGTQIEDGVAKLGALVSDDAAKSFDAAVATMSSSGAVGLAVGLLAVAILAISAVIGVVTIGRPLRALLVPLESVAAGNFAVAVPGTDRGDEIGHIAAAVQSMSQKVSATIAEIKASGREVTNASAEIATSTTDLSQRTEEQAASLEETSAAMEQLSATVRKNAENAQLANRDASATQVVADRGGEVVGRAVKAMARIEESSRKISDIIGVIDEIARQTNLLALNAAVEAARAGEAGRGFAVVASEVRSLAQRSSQAAKDIKDLIVSSNGQVKDGVDLVNKAGESLTEIVESIKKVSVVVAEIANASAEQSTGIDEINRALTQMDQTTQQNSALVEENAATAKTLEHQAKAMDEQVAFFQIAAGHDVPVAAPRAIQAVAVAKPVAAKTVGRAAPTVSRTGPARGMQTALAAAVNEDAWKEF
ncbi:MAG: HAMP domain-containing protein [Pseudolabrys sp.]|nr:HAMP domain-containing protein [Pseudolabrys sp.]